MRVVVAPDKFAGTLTAVEAAQAITTGWRRQAPRDEVLEIPLADGGPGFVDVMHAAHGGQLHAVTVSGPLGDPVPATLLITEGTAYIESAQACGLDLVEPDFRDPERATTYGVGELVVAALDAGVTKVVVGLGGSGTNDGGAGLLAALGATSDPETALTGGPQSLSRLESLDLGPARERLAGVELIAATDVDNPLLGLRGATNVYGPQKGLAKDRLYPVDGALTTYAHLTGREFADRDGAGAAGGLGYALYLLGASRISGFDLVAEAVGLTAAIRGADLVVTGEGRLDAQSLYGKVIAGVAATAAAIRPCIVIAGEVLVGSRELRANGIDSAYSLVEMLGEEAAIERPAESLATAAERVARTWSRR